LLKLLVLKPKAIWLKVTEQKILDQKIAMTKGRKNGWVRFCFKHLSVVVFNNV